MKTDVVFKNPVKGKTRYFLKGVDGQMLEVSKTMYYLVRPFITLRRLFK